MEVLGNSTACTRKMNRPDGVNPPAVVAWIVACAVALSPLYLRAHPSVERVHRGGGVSPRENPPGPTSAEILSQQSCNTQCQERQTDCTLRCDQVAPCIKRCRAEADDCTARCQRGPEAPSPSAPAPSAPAPSAAPSTPPAPARPAPPPPRPAPPPRQAPQGSGPGLSDPVRVDVGAIR